MSKLTKKLTYGQELHTRLAEGVEAIYQVAKAAYGPSAGTASIELPYGDPLISRDGVTNVEKVYLEEPIANKAARIIVQASRKNNRKVGDGTTAVVILAYHLYQAAQQLMSAGHNRMEVARLLESAAEEVIEQIDVMKLPVNDELLQHVAVVSAGDEAVGHMIADVIKEVGTDGGVTVEDFAGVGIYNELVDGFYFRKGFTNVNLTNDPSNLESRHHDVDMFITEKKMATTADIAPILEKFIAAGGKGKDLILVGDVSEEVLGMLLLNRMQGIVNVTVVDMPVFGAMRSLAFEDLALLTGGKVYAPGSNAGDFDISFLGTAKQVVINEYSTTIIGGEGAKEDVDTRVAELHKQLEESESPGTIEALKERLARLTGKVAIIRVGGATEVEQGEVKLRVQDAICAVQAAIKDGVVPGGGIALARISEYFKIPRVDSLVPVQIAHAFARPLMELVDNAGLNSQEAIYRLEDTPLWDGYDLRRRSLVLTDLLKQGVVDPASVTKETVRNATSVVAKLITVAVDISIADRKEKHD